MDAVQRDQYFKVLLKVSPVYANKVCKTAKNLYNFVAFVCFK